VDPVPQDWVHWENALQPLTRQSSGHGCQLHLCVVTLQALPPCAAGTSIVISRVVVPVPQDLVHEVQPIGVLSQSTGQVWALQSWVNARTGQALPLYIAWFLTVRVFCCVPPPHDLVHADHSMV
jgi:hypothetical protein